MEVVGYTRGRGHLSLTLDGYRPCHNAQEVIAKTGYQPEHDLDNPADSVFCAHGAGFVVPWSEVRSHMHVESGWGKAKPARRQRGRLLDVIMAAKVLAVVFGIAPAPQGPPLHRAGSRPCPHPTGQKQQAGGHSRRGPGQRQQHNNGQQH